VQLEQKTLYLANRLRGMRVAGVFALSTSSFTKYPDYSVRLRDVLCMCTNHPRADIFCLSQGPTDLESSSKERLALGSVLRGNCCWGKKDESQHIFSSTFSVEQAGSCREGASQLLRPLESRCWCRQCKGRGPFRLRSRGDVGLSSAAKERAYGSAELMLTNCISAGSA